MLVRLCLFLGILGSSAALAQEQNYNVRAKDVYGVEYFMGNRTPPGTVAVAISAYWTDNHNLPEKKFFFLRETVADNCTKLLHMSLAATLSEGPALLRTVMLESSSKDSSGVITACKMGSKI